MTVTIVKNLSGFKGNAVLVKRENEYFVVSSIDRATDTGKPETLAFTANANGDVTDWQEVAGGIGMSQEATIRSLERHEDVTRNDLD